MTDQALQKTLELFVGFCRSIHGVKLYPYQLDLAQRFIRACLLGTGEDVFAQISRQAGKTETVVLTIEFLMIFYPKIMGRPFRVGIFAPQKEQTKTDFERLKTNLGVSYREGFSEIVDPQQSNAVTLQLSNGSYCYTFPLTETSHPESKTLDAAVYEEANKIKDKEKKDKADPMRTSTNGPALHCGVGGYHVNYFKRAIDRDVNVVKADYAEVIKQKRQVFEQDHEEFHLNYERFVKKQLSEVGLEDESFRTQYGLEFIAGGGSFITANELHALRGDFSQETKHEHECFAGLDTAKFPDRSILTVKCVECKRILCWLRLQGDNYEDQFNIFHERLKRFPNLLFLAIDSTGQGDFMPDLFENRSDIDIIRMKFSLQSKDAMYKNLLSQIRNKATQYPADGSREQKEFEQEMLDLEREWKGEYMSVHHPDDPKAHDDYADSWALAEWAHRHYLENQPDLHVMVTGQKAKSGQVVIDVDDDDDD